jgi:hypothetical protein
MNKIEATLRPAEHSDRTLSVSFTYTERDFVAAYRAIRMVQKPEYDSAIMRLAVIVLGHVFLFCGIMIVGMWMSGFEGPKGKLPLGVVAFNTAIAAFCAWLLYSKIYGYRRQLRWLYQNFDLRDEKVCYQFTPVRFIQTHKRAQGSCDWSFVDGATELRDGFVIQASDANTEWIPKHALNPAFEEVDLSNLLRSKVRNFKVVDRFAELPDKPALKRRAPSSFDLPYSADLNESDQRFAPS